MNGDKLSPLGRLFVGLLCLMCGLFPILAGLGVGAFDVGRAPGVPDWVVIAAGGIFVLAGVAIMADSAGFGVVAGLACALGLAAVGNWMAFGPGVRNCTMTLTGWWTSSRLVGDLPCRLVFGWGAVVTDVLVLLLLLSAIRKVFGDTAGLARLQRAAEWAMLAVLAPLLLILALFALASGGREALSGWYARRFKQIKKDDSDSR